MRWSYCDIADFGEEDLRNVNLSPSRKEYIHRLHREQDRIRSLAAELLVYKILKDSYGVEHAVLHRAENGRPYLTGCDLYVSIAHCGTKLACAVRPEPVGIDIEQIRPVNQNLLRHVCVEAEKAYVTEQDGAQDLRFFEVWTAKEAWFKKCGTGITDLKSVNILPLKREIHLLDGYVIQII